ncbi:hypothetical protein [Kytococcus sp. Marseille-QA3725]
MARGFEAFDDVLADADANAESPWQPGTPPVFCPGLETLEQLIHIPVESQAPSQSGLYGKALDSWFAHELRRAGFDEDRIWPRADEPRVLPRPVKELITRLPKTLGEDVGRRLLGLRSVAPQDANIWGRAYTKQVDVAMSSWQSGPELLISTKAQNSSFGNNLANRFEEAYGDAGNLRARYPLAAVGFAFVMRSTVLDEPAMFERAVDMMRKLRDRGDGNGYTATCLVVVDWDTDVGVKVLEDVVPVDLGPGQFFEAVIDQVLEAAPVTEHVLARELRLGEHLAVDEGD